jgi:L-rhamnose mutarotase
LVLKFLLKENRISDYSISLDEETNTLFTVQKNSGYRSSLEMGKNESAQKWWE